MCEQVTGTRAVLMALCGGVMAGVGYAAALPPLNAWPIAWVCFVPLIVFARYLSLPYVISAAWGSGWLYVVVSGYWIFEAPQVALGTSPLATGVVWLGVAGPFCGIAPLTSATIGEWLARGRNAVPRTIGWPMGWVIGELLRSYGPIAMPWTLLGVTQVAVLPIAQTAALGGTALISCVLVCCNTLFAEAIVRRSRSRLFGGCAIFLTLWLLGWMRLAGATAPLDAESTDHAVRVAMIQGNYPQSARSGGDAIVRNAYENQHVLLSRRALATSDAEVLVWPETSAGQWAVDHGAIGTAFLHQVVSSEGTVTLMAGTTVVDASSGTEPASYYNAAFSRDAVGDFRIYRKRRLVPFAERIPSFLFGLDIFDMKVTLASPRTPGPEPPQLLMHAHSPVGAIICFEFLYPSTLRSTARAGAEWIAIFTNDGWYDASRVALDQHHAQAQLAAIAVGRTIVRSNNTGRTEAFDPWGRSIPFIGAEMMSSRDGASGPISAEDAVFSEVNVQGPLPSGIPAWGTVSVRPVQSRTPFFVLGAWPGWVALCALACIAAKRLVTGSNGADALALPREAADD